MKTGQRWASRLLAGAIIIWLPAVAYALGLGRMVVNSGLDQPLNGEIELLSPTADELKSLSTSLAPRAEFDNAGIDRPPFLSTIKYEVTRRNNGRYYLKLTSDQPIHEPFLHFLLQVEWNGGRLIREYTALLDPPQWASSGAANIDAPLTEAPEEFEAEVEEEAEPSPEELLALKPDVPAAVPEPLAPATETPVAENLEPIAKEPALAEPATPVEPKQTPTVAQVKPTPPKDERLLGPPPATEPPSSAPLYTGLPIKPIPEQVVGSDWARTDEYGPVKRGETLGSITQKIHVDKSLSAEQVMLALMKTNPSAFSDNNVNNLKAGKILKIPARETIESIPKRQALKEFRAQYDVWQEYKLKLAASSQTVKLASAPEKPAEPKTVQKAETPAKEKASVAPEKAAVEKPVAKEPAKEKEKEKPAGTANSKPGVADDLLKIVRSSLDKSPKEGAKSPGVETQKGENSEQSALSEKVATLEEAIESKQIQNKELRERVGKMQENVKTAERLIELENKELAKAQKQASEKQAAEKAAAEKAEAEKAAVEKAAAEKQATEKLAAEKLAAEKQAAEKQAAEKLAAEKAPAPANAAKAPPQPAAETPAQAKRPTVPVGVPPVEQPSFLQDFLGSLLENTLTVALLAGVGVIGFVIMGMYYVRRRRATAEFEESILSGGSLNTEGGSISDSGSQQAASDTSFLSDFSQGGMGNIHTDEVDPIAEAEVYLAYGRDEQAEEILKEAIVKDPARHELKQKLLEIYHQRNDASGFETLAEELYASLEGKGGKIWEKVEEMGRKISPNNPMFGGAGAGSRLVKPADSTMSLNTTAGHGMTTDRGMAALSGVHMADKIPPPPPAAGSGLDFDLGAPAESGASSGSIDFNLDFGDVGSNKTPGAPATNELDMDFNFQTDNQGSSNSVNFESTSSQMGAGGEIDFDSTASLDSSTDDKDLSFNLDSDGEAPALNFEPVTEVAEAEGGEELEEGQWDETATKLDLAKAYIDMGDSEGARSILDEVLAEGNDSQKQQARELVEQIA